jgi:Uma2 family endonuclease
MNLIPQMKPQVIPPLENGDRLKQKEFHRRYEQYPEDVKIELVGGIVFMASPLRLPHGKYHLKLGMVVDHYVSKTPGVDAADNATAILGEESEPQPDLSMWVSEACGGRAKANADQYLEGPPELIAEIAHSSVAIDLHKKREDYKAAGVLEYLVLCIAEQEIIWFHFPSGKEIKATKEGVFKSKVFPGFWLDGPALLARDSEQLRVTVQQGLETKEHAAFVKRLEKSRKKSEK